MMKLQILILLLCPLLLAKSYTLREVVELTLQNSKEIEESTLVVEKAENDLNEAKDIWKPKLEVTAFAAPIWETTGNHNSSKDNYSKWGIFTGAEITMIQPVYLWGMDSNLKNAAKNGVLAAKSKGLENRNAIIKRITSYYYGNLLTKKLLALATSTFNKLEKVEDHLNKKGNTREIIKFKLKRNLIREKLDEAQLAYDLTQRGLRFYTSKDDLALEEGLKLLPFVSDEIAHFNKTAKEKNLLLSQLEHGLEARRELITAEKKKKLPQVFLGAKGNLKYSDVKDRQSSAFVNDSYNQAGGGVFLGLKLNLNFREISAQERKAILEHKKLEIKKGYAAKGIDLKVKNAFDEFISSKKLAKNTKKSMKLAKRLFIKESLRFDLRKKNGKELVESLLGKVLAIKNYYTAVAKCNTKYIELLNLSGYDLSGLNLY